MKINWGHKIAAFYSSFVLFIGIMVYLAFNQQYDLVTEDYYEKEIRYQSTIDKKERTKALAGNMQAMVDAGNLKVLFPPSMKEIAGTVNCFRPSDQSMDFSEDFSTSKGEHAIALEKFTKGKYLLKVEWTNNTENYYQELTVIIP